MHNCPIDYPKVDETISILTTKFRKLLCRIYLYRHPFQLVQSVTITSYSNCVDNN